MMVERDIVRNPENTFEWTIHEPFYRWRNEFEEDFSLHARECLRWRMSVVTTQGVIGRKVSCRLSYAPTSQPFRITADVSTSVKTSDGEAFLSSEKLYEFTSINSYEFGGYPKGLRRETWIESGDFLVISVVIDRLCDANRPTRLREDHWGNLNTFSKLSSDLCSMYEHERTPTLILVAINRDVESASIVERFNADDKRTDQARHPADNQEDSGNPATFPEDGEKEFKERLQKEDRRRDEEREWARVIIDDNNEEELRAAMEARKEELPSTKYVPFYVHHAILEKRWPTYFTDHKLAYRRVYDTWMYSDTLHKILLFVYSGEYLPDDNQVEASEPNSELSQILLETDLLHMCRRNQRSTKVCCETAARGLWRIFNVNLRIGTQNPVQRSLLPQCDAAETSYFEVREGMFNGRPWLCYSISGMRSSCEVYMHMRDSTGRSIPVNIHDHAVEDDGRVESGPVLYLGSRATFGDYLMGNDLRLCFEVGYGKIRGKIQRQFRNDDSLMDLGLRNPYSLIKLSNDMRKVLIEGNFTDTDIYSECEEGRRIHQLVHKAILETRIPCPRLLTGDIEQGRLKLGWKLRNKSFPYVLNFIYTGETPSIPDNLVRHVHRFGRQHGYEDLNSSIAREADFEILAGTDSSDNDP